MPLVLLAMLVKALVLLWAAVLGRAPPSSFSFSRNWSVLRFLGAFWWG